jgi:uncharacterized membrane protein YhaH (DUF805 family)
MATMRFTQVRVPIFLISRIVFTLGILTLVQRLSARRKSIIVMLMAVFIVVELVTKNSYGKKSACC